MVVNYNDGPGAYVDSLYIQAGHLYAVYHKEGAMATKDLGQVVPTITVTKTDTTAPGTNANVTATQTGGTVGLTFGIPRGAVGATGTAGKDGVTPSLSINADGHLIADYDNPVV